MQDHKMAAAGERDENLPRLELHENYAKAALTHLLIYTRAEMSDDERVLWEQRLSTVPVWKLKRINEFYSPFINKVWEFFEYLRPLPQKYEDLPALPEPKSNIGRDTIKHVLKVLEYACDGKLTSERLAEKRRIEREGLEELNRKYPTAGFDRVLGEKRFQENFMMAAAGEKGNSE